MFDTLSILAGIMVFLCVFIAPIFVYVPSAALGGVIIVSAASMFAWFDIKQIWKRKRLDIIPLGVTFVVCLYSSSLGIMVGIVVHAGMLLGKFLHPVKKVENKKDETCLVLGGPLLYPSSEVGKYFCYCGPIRPISVT